LSIRQTQANLFDQHYVGEGPASGVSFPDMVRLAEAYRIPARRVSSHEELEDAFRWALEAQSGPTLVDVMTDPDQFFAPKAQAQRLPNGRLVSKPLEDLWPFLPMDELQQNLLIPPWQPPE
ncbi:MAG: thiamine pyrophosphate-dependent enzyme, partial [Actinobacteria bacterium]|nr:thiamine pyrophosphate-dependent enzyme [Actinomycetota bacterium]